MQIYGVLLMFIGFYIVGLALAYILMYVVKIDIYGFWVGVIVAAVLITIAAVIIIWYFDWNAISIEAHKHIRYIDPSILSAGDSVSPSDTNEYMQLIPRTSDQNNDVENSEYNAIQMPPVNDEEKANETVST